MNRMSKRILLGAGLAAGVVAAAAASYAVTKKMVTVALDRKMPKVPGSKKTLTGSEDVLALLRMQEEAAKKLENSGCQTVEITAYDGVHLIGHLYRCENAKRTVIAMHGWRSSWLNDFGIISEFMFQNQCNVLFAEQRGQGQSGGDYMGFGMLERHDCLYWISWIGQQDFAALPIYLVGVSMGASTVLMTAGFDLPDTVKGIIADCGFTSAHEIWKYVTESNLPLLYTGLRGELANDICRRKIQIGSKDYSCIDALQTGKTPVLFIHGTDDKFVPIEMTYENYKACVAPKRLFIVPGAEHGLSYVVDKAGYEAAVKRFWREFDN